METKDILHRRRGWSGDISGLAAEAARLQSDLGLADGADGPNLRLVRHYRSIGCVGRPTEREGARGLYGYRQLLETVAVRVLLRDGWKLAKIGEALAALEDGAVERLVIARGAPIGGAAAQAAAPRPGAEGSPAAGAPVGRAASQEVLDLLAGFRRSAGLPAPAAAATVPPESLRGSQAPPSRVVTEHSPAQWLRISVDEQALARAEPGAVARALAEAAAILARLGP